MISENYLQHIYAYKMLLNILICFLLIIQITLAFKCESDGLFEDEMDCTMYYECLWIGTQFEKQDHVKCADGLLYNPKKHRCDEIGEFEAQFANGVSSTEDLLEFIRFRNCLSKQDNSDDTNDTNNMDSQNVEQIYDGNNRAEFSNDIIPNNSLDSLISKPNNDINLLSSKNEGDINENDLLRNISDKQEYTANNTNSTGKNELLFSLEAEKVSLNITNNPNSTKISNSKESIKKLSDNFSKETPRIINVNNNKNNGKYEKVDEHVNSNTTSNTKETDEVQNVPVKNSVYLMEDEKMYYGKKLLLDNKISKNSDVKFEKNKIDQTEFTTPNDGRDTETKKSRHMSFMKIFIRRRVFKTTTNHDGLINDQNNMETFDSTDMLSDEPVTTTIANKIKRDETNKTNNQNQDLVIQKARSTHSKLYPNISKRKILSIDTTDYAEDISEYPNDFDKNKILSHNELIEPVKVKNESVDLIDEIEQRLTKRGENLNHNGTIVKMEQKNNQSNDEIENFRNENLNESVNSSILSNPVVNEFLMVNKINESYFNQTIFGRKPLKLVRKLKNENITINYGDNDKKEEERDIEIDDIPTTITSTSTANMSTTTIKNKISSSSRHFIKPNFSNKIPLLGRNGKSQIKNEKFELIERNSTTISKMRVFHLKPLPLNDTSETSYIVESSNQPPTSSKQDVNEANQIFYNTTKKFGSLYLFDQNFTKIRELEKGGKFQRLLYQPTDTLIECKDNDFGLECSCSVTLSPPKCKQLINSFLSSCRIVGCKNNGKCINMAYKYPIPYICSCPSLYMGTYCEIQRNNDASNFYPKDDVFAFPKEFKEPACHPNPCFNNGVCEIMQDSVRCTCVNSSFSGQYCEVFTPRKSLQTTTQQINHWNCPSGCGKDKGRGKCILSMLGYPKCICEEGWTGMDCNQPDYCLYNDCLNNSTCSNVESEKTYICVCPKGFSGRRCEVMATSYFQQQQVVPYNYPNSNPCGSVTCQNNGTCIMSFSHAKGQFSFVCICALGFHGILCETPNNPCDSNPCKITNSICIALSPNNYKCLCNNGTIDCSLHQTFHSFIGKGSLHDDHQKVRLRMENSNETTTLKSKTTKTTLTSTTSAIATPTTTTPLPQTSSTIHAETVAVTASTTKIMTNTKLSTKSKTYVSDKLEKTPQSNYKKTWNDNPCVNDNELCRKYPYGNDSFVCVNSVVTHDYSLCLYKKSIDCLESNPCLNGGTCITLDYTDTSTWKCLCDEKYTGELCETEICSDIFNSLPNHTMCTPNSQNLKLGGMEPIDIELILDMHNSLRRQVIPTAADMQKMYWDIRLQQLAQKRAQLCSAEPQNMTMRQLPGYGVVIGENLAAGYDTWAHVLSSWISESKNFIFNMDTINENLQAGHYTQMIYSAASRIGCGFAQCSNTTYDRYFVCYYGEMQTYYSRYEPYHSGNTCSMCSNNCKEGLCDCKGVYCSNGGILDLNTCKCTCPHSTFTGQYCEKVNCPKEDSPFCSQSLFKDKCWLYPVVRSNCPYMCLLCDQNNAQSFNQTINIDKTL